MKGRFGSAGSRLGSKVVRSLVFACQGFGAVFLIVFVAAYLGGLPGSVVLNSVPVIRALLQVTGGLFLTCALCVLVSSASYLRDRFVEDQDALKQLTKESKLVTRS